MGGSSSGDDAEALGAQFLSQNGLQLVRKNFRCKPGEIDLIMLDQHYLVFVEVRYRKNTSFGSPLETVTRSKQSRVRAAAQIYLMRHPYSGPMRFDVLGISGDLRQADIEWCKNAF